MNKETMNKDHTTSIHEENQRLQKELDEFRHRARKVVGELVLKTEFFISDRSEVVNFRVTFYRYLDQLKAGGAIVTSHVKYAVKVRDIHGWRFDSFWTTLPE